MLIAIVFLFISCNTLAFVCNIMENLDAVGPAYQTFVLFNNLLVLILQYTIKMILSGGCECLVQHLRVHALLGEVSYATAPLYLLWLVPTGRAAHQLCRRLTIRPSSPFRSQNLYPKIWYTLAGLPLWEKALTTHTETCIQILSIYAIKKSFILCCWPYCQLHLGYVYSINRELLVTQV